MNKKALLLFFCSYTFNIYCPPKTSREELLRRLQQKRESVRNRSSDGQFAAEMLAILYGRQNQKKGTVTGQAKQAVQASVQLGNDPELESKVTQVLQNPTIRNAQAKKMIEEDQKQQH